MPPCIYYRQMTDSLVYLTNTRPDICFAVNTLNQYMVEPRRVHLVATKHVLRYLKCTVDYGLRYDVDCEIRLHWAGSVRDWKSTYGCCFCVGLNMISWFSKSSPG
jgi:hypothetical protein